MYQHSPTTAATAGAVACSYKPGCMVVASSTGKRCAYPRAWLFTGSYRQGLVSSAIFYFKTQDEKCRQLLPLIGWMRTCMRAADSVSLPSLTHNLQSTDNRHCAVLIAPAKLFCFAELLKTGRRSTAAAAVDSDTYLTDCCCWCCVCVHCCLRADQLCKVCTLL